MKRCYESKTCAVCGAPIKVVKNVFFPRKTCSQKCRQIKWALDQVNKAKRISESVIKIAPVVLFFFLSAPAFAQIPEDVAVRCLMGEARNQSYACQVATAEALRNRGTTKGVYGCQAKFNEPAWVWARSKKAWRESEHSNLTGGASFWESTDFPTPYWAKQMRVTAHVGKHIFYKPTENSHEANLPRSLENQEVLPRSRKAN